MSHFIISFAHCPIQLTLDPSNMPVCHTDSEHFLMPINHILQSKICLSFRNIELRKSCQALNLISQSNRYEEEILFLKMNLTNLVSQYSFIPSSIAVRTYLVRRQKYIKYPTPAPCLIT